VVNCNAQEQLARGSKQVDHCIHTRGQLLITGISKNIKWHKTRGGLRAVERLIFVHGPSIQSRRGQSKGTKSYHETTDGSDYFPELRHEIALYSFSSFQSLMASAILSGEGQVWPSQVSYFLFHSAMAVALLSTWGSKITHLVCASKRATARQIVR
jgi:hypothetical protein